MLILDCDSIKMSAVVTYMGLRAPNQGATLKTGLQAACKSFWTYLNGRHRHQNVTQSMNFGVRKA